MTALRENTFRDYYERITLVHYQEKISLTLPKSSLLLCVKILSSQLGSSPSMLTYQLCPLLCMLYVHVCMSMYVLLVERESEFYAPDIIVHRVTVLSSKHQQLCSKHNRSTGYILRLNLDTKYSTNSCSTLTTVL